MPKGIYYMLYCATPQAGRSVDKGDAVRVLVMGYDDRSNHPELSMAGAVKKTVTQWQSSHSEQSKEACRQWGPWTCLWGSETHNLLDLGDKDSEALLELYNQARIAFQQFEKWARRK